MIKYALTAMLVLAAGGPAFAAAPDTSAVLEANRQAVAENALITKANAALAAKHWQEAETTLKQLLTQEPASWDFELALGTAQLGLTHYADAAASFGKAFEFAQAAAKGKMADAAKAKEALGPILINRGNAFLKLQKNADAKAAYTQAAALDAHPAVAYFNLCAILYNMGEMTDVVAACDKAIAADPKKADAYFIKGSALYGNATVGTDNKMVVSKEALDALRKYLALAPNGAHVADVKAMLEAVGEPVTASEKPKPK